MTIKLITKRILDKYVEVSLVFKRVIEEKFYPRINATITNKYGETAVIFNFWNAKNSRVSSSILFGEIEFSDAFTFEDSVKKIRVFYWNDDQDMSDADIAAFKEKFDEVRLDPEFKIGDFILPKLIHQPRQGGNGGVIGISQT